MCLFDRNHQRNQRKYRKSTIKVDLNSKITTSIAQAEESARENDDFFNTIVDELPFSYLSSGAGTAENQK